VGGGVGIFIFSSSSDGVFALIGKELPPCIPGKGFDFCGTLTLASKDPVAMMRLSIISQPFSFGGACITPKFQPTEGSCNFVC
jgi:hypothetical protein